MTSTAFSVRRGSRWAVAASVVALAATGCSTNAASSTSGGGGDCGKTLKLGILTDFTGELGEFGKTSKQGFDFAVKQMNSSGRLPNGWKVDTVVGDEKTNVQEGLRAATSMIQSDHVSAILGPSSGPIVAMVKLSEQNQTPIISQFAGTVNLDSVGGKWIYRTVASDTSDGAAAATWLHDKGVSKAVVLVQNDQSTVSAAQAMSSAFSHDGGSVVDTVKYNAGQPSYQTIVQQALGSNPEAIFLAGGQESGVTILKELFDAGYASDKVLVSADMAVPELIQAIGSSKVKGMQGETAQGDPARPEYKTFAQAFKTANGKAPGLFVDNAYDAANLVGLAAVAAGSTCGAAINDHLRAVANGPGEKVTTFAQGAKALAAGKKINYEGASGPVDFDKSGTVAGSYAILQVTNGEWQQAKFYPASTFSQTGP